MRRAAFLIVALAALVAPGSASAACRPTAAHPYEVVTPYQSQALTGSTVTNVVLQNRCPGDLTEHVGIIYDPVALQWVRDALPRPGPANPAFVPDCSGRTTGDDPSLPADTRGASIAPHVELRGASMRVAGDSRIRVPVRCVAAAGKTCRGLLVVRAGGRPAAARAFSVPAGRAARLTLRLGPRARRASSLTVSAPQALTRTYAVRHG
jgi:hypothetical protein